MLWIDDVINDLQKFCNDNGYTESSEKLGEARKVYHAELQQRFKLEVSPMPASKTTTRFPSRFAEASNEHLPKLQLIHPKT